MGRSIFIFILLFIVIFFSINKIHGSSIGMYNILLFGEDYKDDNLLLGKPRAIRSDEWVVTTPLAISQSLNNFNHLSSAKGVTQEMSIFLDIPTNHWSTIFKPYNWSFFVLPLENAFAFRWWFRGALLILSVYLVVDILTRNQRISIVSSLIIFFSPFVQWWYSGSGAALEVISYGFFALYFFIKILGFKNKKILILHSTLLVYFLISYVLIIYPPFQISAGLFFLFFAIGYFLNNVHNINRAKLGILAKTLGIITAVVLMVLIFYYLDFKEVLELLSSTNYPGEREAIGGQYNIMRLFSGYFNILNIDESVSFPQIFANKSEASNFFLWYPFLLPTVLAGLTFGWLKHKKIDFIILATSLYLLLATSWLFLGLPKIISYPLLLHRVPEYRMILGIGLANFILAIYYLYQFKSFSHKYFTFTAIFFGLIASSVHIWIGLYLKSNTPLYVSLENLPMLGTTTILIVIVLIVYASVTFLITKHKYLFMSTILTYSIIYTAIVNPLYEGLDLIVNSPLISQLLETTDKEMSWIVYDNLVLSNYLAAGGVKILSGTMMYPQFDIWQKFDPQGNYYNIYNRYAHVTFGQMEGDKIEFELFSADHFRVNINPCHKILKGLDVKYYVFTAPVNYPCLKMVKSLKNLETPIYLFTPQ